MPRISVHLPSMLAAAIGSARVEVDASTLEEAIAALRRDHPRIATHVFDDLGRQRRHVLLFLNDRDTRWITPAPIPLASTDTLSIVQAISGG